MYGKQNKTKLMYGCLTHEDTHLGGHFQDMNPSDVRKLSQYTISTGNQDILCLKNQKFQDS